MIRPQRQLSPAFTLLEVIIVTLIVAVLGGIAWKGSASRRRDAKDDDRRSQEMSVSPQSQADEQETASQPENSEAGSSAVAWTFNGSAWQASGTPPPCPPQPFLKAPVDTKQAVSILYPGQTRGGNYKPHGGFRFADSAKNAASVTLPLDAVVVKGARYLVGGETQYTFDFIAPCGVMIRMGHFLELTPDFQKIADTFPEAKEGDSRTTQVNPPVAFKAGAQIATAVGIRKENNTFVDFGVFDLRAKNAVSADSAWGAQHSPELDHFAVCWFDWIPAEDEARVRALPAGDPTSGKRSDFCK